MHLNADEALGERIINTPSLPLKNSSYESTITNIRSFHLNEFRVRMHIYHSLVPSHEKRIVVGILRILNLTLILTANKKSEFFSGTLNHNENWTDKKIHFQVSIISATVEIIQITGRKTHNAKKQQTRTFCVV